MLVKDWDVAYSFGIRYKHLLVNGQCQRETDENIDHILGVGSDEEDGSDNEEDDVKSGNTNGQDDDDIDDEDDSDEEMGQGSLTGQYLHTSGYTNAPQYPHPYPMLGAPPKQHEIKQEKSSRRASKLQWRPQPSSHNKGQQGYGQLYPYGPPLDPWGRPIPYGGGPDGYGGYSGYGMYGGYGGHGAPSDNDGRSTSQPPAFNGMGQYLLPRQAMTPAPSQPDSDGTDRRRAQGSPPGGNKRIQGGYEQSTFSNGRPGFPPHSYPQNFQTGHTESKQESLELEMRGDGREMSVDEADGPANDLGENTNAAALEAELRATELELKVARLQAKRAALSQQSRAK